jgi:hypothetical protein
LSEFGRHRVPTGGLLLPDADANRLVDVDCAEVAALGHQHLATLLLAAVGTPAQLALIGSAASQRAKSHQAFLATLLLAPGQAAFEPVAAWYDVLGPHHRGELAGAIALLPAVLTGTKPAGTLPPWAEPAAATARRCSANRPASWV